MSSINGPRSPVFYPFATSMSDLCTWNESLDKENNKQEGYQCPQILTLNIGGQIFKCRSSIFKSKDGRLAKQIEVGGPESYFFDRDPRFFPAVLNYYRTGKLHLDRTFCAIQWKEEMEFWQLTEDSIADCCWRRYCDLLEQKAHQDRVSKELREINGTDVSGNAHSPSWKRSAWKTLEDPNYSRTARVIFVLYGLFVFLCLGIFWLESYCQSRKLMIDQCEAGDKKNGSWSQGDGLDMCNSSCGFFQSRNATTNGSISVSSGSGKNSMTSEGSESPCNHDFHLVRFVREIELGPIVVYSIWFVLRTVTCPCKHKFCTSILNLVDFVYLVMSWHAAALHFITGTGHWKCENIGVDAFIAIMHIKVVVGCMRLFRLVRYYRGTRELWLAIRASFREIKLLTIFVALGVVVFGSMFYCSELMAEKPMDNVLQAYWWAIITMTTVGYGDVVPHVHLSYFVGSACAMVGLVMIALPIPFLTNNFKLYYGFRCRKRDSATLTWLKTRQSISISKSIRRNKSSSQSSTHNSRSNSAS